VPSELLCPDQGDTIVNPTPDPRSKRMRVAPMAAAAPPKIGPHVTADLEDSTGAAISPEPVIETDIISPIAQTEREG
jgi:hypothetical protein